MLGVSDCQSFGLPRYPGKYTCLVLMPEHVLQTSSAAQEVMDPGSPELSNLWLHILPNCSQLSDAKNVYKDRCLQRPALKRELLLVSSKLESHYFKIRQPGV